MNRRDLILTSGAAITATAITATAIPFKFALAASHGGSDTKADRLNAYWHNYRLFKAQMAGKDLVAVKHSADRMRLGPFGVVSLLICEMVESEEFQDYLSTQNPEETTHKPI